MTIGFHSRAPLAVGILFKSLLLSQFWSDFDEIVFLVSPQGWTEAILKILIFDT